MYNLSAQQQHRPCLTLLQTSKSAKLLCRLSVAANACVQMGHSFAQSLERAATLKMMGMMGNRSTEDILKLVHALPALQPPQLTPPMPPGHPALTPVTAPTHAAASMWNTPLTMPSPSISQQQPQMPLHGPVAATPSSVAAKPRTWFTPAPCKEPMLPATTIDLATASTTPVAIPALDHCDCGQVAGSVHKCDKCGRHMHPFCGEKLGAEGFGQQVRCRRCGGQKGAPEGN